MKTQTIEIKATNQESRKLLARSLKWIRRIDDRANELPKSFTDNCDVKPLRKAIEAHLSR